MHSTLAQGLDSRGSLCSARSLSSFPAPTVTWTEHAAYSSLTWWWPVAAGAGPGGHESARAVVAVVCGAHGQCNLNRPGSKHGFPCPVVTSPKTVLRFCVLQNRQYLPEVGTRETAMTNSACSLLLVASCRSLSVHH
jgi:hypothetical protein